MNFNYFPYPLSTRLKLIEGKPHFRDESLQFLFSTAESFVFYDASLNSEITISIDRGKGTMQANETGGLYFRAWESSADAREFSEWSQRFRELGFSSNRFGFVPQTKFIDGTRTDLRREERRVFVLEVRGNTVFWDGEAVTLSVVTMENNSLAVELAKQGSTFWLYGGGNFQVSSPGVIKTVYVGSSAPPTGSTISGSVPQPYVDLYPKLKAMAQAY